MSPYTPDEPAATLFLERTFVAGDVVVGTGYGIQIMLYLGCARYLWRQLAPGKRQTPFLLAYITALILVESVFIGVQARTVQDMYIDNREFPGGPWQFFLTAESIAVNALFIATIFVLNFMSDALVLWRCWAIWTAVGRRGPAAAAVALPALVLLASFVVGVLWAVKSSTPGLSLYSNLPVELGTSYYALSLGVNVLLTILIAARLLAYRRQVAAALQSHGGEEGGRSYVSLAAIFIESAALYSVCALLFLVTYALGSPMNQIFLGMTNTAQQVATYLIIWRVADGRRFARGRGEGEEAKANVSSTLGFAARTRSNKQQSVLESVLASTVHRDGQADDRRPSESTARSDAVPLRVMMEEGKGFNDAV